jgi:hypothetical protein
LKHFYDGLSGYLTEQAKLLKDFLVKNLGLDPDLAHVILESNCNEDELYKIEE